MTFSIVARAETRRPDGSMQQSFGVAVASKFLAVGAAVPAADPVVGAIATQAFANLAYRPQALTLLRTGAQSADVIAGLTAADQMSGSRQVGVVGAEGPGATFTGEECTQWAGGLAGPDFAIQGNMLVGAQVVERMREEFTREPDRPFARRLLDALRAGDEVGGDKRGRQSAALLIARCGGGYGGGSDIEVDLRVDDHPAPVPELARLLDLHELYFGRPAPETLLELTGPLADEVTARLARLGYTAGQLDDALAQWAGAENFEERMAPGRIDPLVLDQLRSAGAAEEGA